MFLYDRLTKEEQSRALFRDESAGQVGALDMLLHCSSTQGSPWKTVGVQILPVGRA